MNEPVDSTFKCDICNHYLQYYFDKGKDNNGLYVCPNCGKSGDRQDVNKQDLIKYKTIINKKEENKMAKRGTCVKCGRENMSIATAGLCGKCYYQQKKGKKKKVREVSSVNKNKTLVKSTTMKTASSINKMITCEIEIPQLNKYRVKFDVNFTIENIRIE